jgi:hypothetical protein
MNTRNVIVAINAKHRKAKLVSLPERIILCVCGDVVV